MMQPSKKRQRAGHRTGHNAARRHSREKGTTMFYIKPNEHTRIEITGENVYTTCPGCGEEFPVDLAELAADGELDLYSTQVFCPECSRYRLQELRRQARRNPRKQVREGRKA